MLINLRNALMAGKRLPYDAEVEYLECAGTSSVFPYIDTGIVGTSDVTFTASVYRSTNTTNECAIGAYGSSLRYWASYFFSNTYFLGMGSKTNNSTNAPTETWMLQELKAENGNFNLYSNGSLVATCETSTFDTDQNIYIGAMNSSGLARYFFRGRFGAVKIYQNGVLVRDFVPVRKGTVGYLYDRVSGKLFGNAGTGDFVLGPDVVPVEYLQSSGTQWINTGIMPTSSTVVSGDFRRQTQFSNWRGLFGSGTGASSKDCFCVGLRYNNSYVEGFVNGLANKYIFTANNDRFSIEMTVPQITVVRGENTYTALTGKTSLGESSRDISIFRANSGDANLARPCAYYCYGFKISNGTDLARSFRPVRVGTDATSWEGAMMDVLARRIYRNVGTGAFTYGNDLKYPIPSE